MSEETLTTVKCVGFADCSCRSCRASRVAHTKAHPRHEHIQDRSYCGACRTERKGA